MYSSHSSHPDARPRFIASAAFTLIELLTVIAIIAILMGLLFPALATVKENARRVQAKNDQSQIIAAIKNYYTEYGKYPPLEKPGAGTSGKADELDAFVGEKVALGTPKGDNSLLFNTLRAKSTGTNNINENDRLNPRRVVFYEGKAVANAEQPRAGFLEKMPTSPKPNMYEGALYDPWGKQYTIMIDTNYDNVLDMQQIYSDFASPNQPRVSVGIVALGKDEVVGSEKGTANAYRSGQTASDDIISWQ